jgi:hypothetical protein
MVKVCEDSLTAVVFDTLKYLPSELFWSVLKKSLYHDKLPNYSGDILEIVFWPRWSAENTSNTNSVIPDLFIRFQELDIIIEAKRRNEKQQSNGQMNDQIQAYFNEFADDEKQLYFIQLGGLHNKDNIQNIESNNREVVICKTDWTKILDQVVLEKIKLKHNDLSFVQSYTRILEDTVIGFEMHGYYKKLWLKDLKIKSPINYVSLKHQFHYVKRK